MKHFAWIVGLYLLADLVTPGLPSRFSIESDTSVKVARAQRLPRAHMPAPADVTPAASLDSRPVVLRPSPVVSSHPGPAKDGPVAWWPPPLRGATEVVDADPSHA